MYTGALQHIQPPHMKYLKSHTPTLPVETQCLPGWSSLQGDFIVSASPMNMLGCGALIMGRLVQLMTWQGHRTTAVWPFPLGFVPFAWKAIAHGRKSRVVRPCGSHTKLSEFFYLEHCFLLVAMLKPRGSTFKLRLCPPLLHVPILTEVVLVTFAQIIIFHGSVKFHIDFHGRLFSARK